MCLFMGVALLPFPSFSNFPLLEAGLNVEAN